MAKKRGNKEGTIYKRDNGNWRAQVTIDGQRLGYSGKTQRECQLWLRETLNSIDEGYSFEGSKTLLGDFLLTWLVSISSSRQQSTIDLYERTVLLNLIPILGEIPLKDLRPDHIQGLYDQKRQDGQSEHAVHMIHKVLNGALTHGVKLG